MALYHSYYQQSTNCIEKSIIIGKFSQNRHAGHNPITLNNQQPFTNNTHTCDDTVTNKQTNIHAWKARVYSLQKYLHLIVTWSQPGKHKQINDLLRNNHFSHDKTEVKNVV